VRGVLLPFALVLLCAGRPASAQTLGWDEMLRRARVHAPGAITAAQSVRAARADAQGAGRWPRTNPVVRLVGDLETAEDPSYVAGGGIEQQFDLAGVAVARGRLAQASVRAAEQEARVSSQDALRAAADAFVDLDLAQRSIAIWISLGTLYEQIARAATQTEAAGITSRQQTLLATIEQRSIAADLNQAEAERARARATLALLVGAVASPALAVQSDEDLPPPDARPLETLLAYALTHRPEIGAARAEIEVAQRRGVAARRELIPAPTLHVGVRRERLRVHGTEILPDTRGQVGIGGIDHRSVAVVAELSFELPLFDRNLAERARAEADAATGRENVALAERRIRAELEAALGARAAAWATYERWRVMAHELDEAQALAQRGYDAGQVGITDTLVALERVARGRLALVRSRAEYWRAQVALARVLGELR
jgi:cobalt-zinc-cadmium efflux system outer membrane protein